MTTEPMTPVLTPDQDERFSLLAPEFRPLVRGWAWEWLRRTGLDGELARKGITAALWLVSAVGFYALFDIRTEVDNVQTLVSNLLGAAICGGILNALVLFISSISRNHLIERKAGNLSVEARQQLALKLLTMVREYPREQLLDSRALNKIQSSEVAMESAREEIEWRLKQLVDEAYSAAENLVSDEPFKLNLAFTTIAGDNELSLKGRLAKLRKAVDEFPRRVELHAARNTVIKEVEGWRREPSAAATSGVN